MARCFLSLDRIGPGNRLCSRYRLNKSMNVNCFIDQLSSGILHCHVPPQGRIVTRVFEDMILGDATLLCEGIFCIFVPLRGLLALVHRWGYGWDGVYWGRVQHEWFGLWVPAVQDATAEEEGEFDEEEGEYDGWTRTWRKCLWELWAVRPCQPRHRRQLKNKKGCSHNGLRYPDHSAFPGSSKVRQKIHNEQEGLENTWIWKIWKQNLFGGKNDGVQFTMFLSCNITLSKVSCVQIWIDSAYMAWIMICMLFFNLFTFVYYLLVRSCYQVVLKLRGSCLLRVALKHPQSLCLSLSTSLAAMRELVHVQGGQMSDIGLYACKIRRLSLFLAYFFCHALVSLVPFFLWHTWSIFKPVADMLWHAGAPFSLARPVRKPDWCQVLGSHRRWARHWPNRYLVPE